MTQTSKGTAPRRSRAFASWVNGLVAAQAIEPAEVARDLCRLSPLERAAEVLRYAVARAEYWLSPGGTLRALLRLSLKVSAGIGIPALIVGPVATAILKGAAAASALFLTIAVNLAFVSIALVLVVIGLALLPALCRMLLLKK